MLSEFKEEAETTKRVLERVPEEKLAGAPHPRSMSLGQLALDVGKSPGEVAGQARMSAFDVTMEELHRPALASKGKI